jgi:hypothetical protein
MTISLPVGGARLGNADDGLAAAVLVGADVSAVEVAAVVGAADAAVVGAAVVAVEPDELLLQAARRASVATPAPHSRRRARREKCPVDVFMVPPRSS